MRRARLASTVLLVVLATGSARTAAPAAAAPGDQQTIVAARVATLTDSYRRDSAAAAAAAARLARAYTALSTADDDAQTADDGAARARQRLADRVRDLYALGPAAHGELALLSADSPQDALWQLSVGALVAERLIGDDADARREAELHAVAARSRTHASLAAAGQLDDLLTALRRAQDSASWALDAARGELARLQAVAADAQVAREAAARLARARQDSDTTRLAASEPVGALTIPPDVERAYRDAATTCPGMTWTLLAAVGQIESGHGRNDGPSSAGAIGPMQFMPSTFAAYAVDGDGDGTTDAWNVRDAVFTAAHYLCTSGAGLGPDGVHAALLTYNHAEWYVDLVLAAQAAIVAREQR